MLRKTLPTIKSLVESNLKLSSRSLSFSKCHFCQYQALSQLQFKSIFKTSPQHLQKSQKRFYCNSKRSKDDDDNENGPEEEKTPPSLMKEFKTFHDETRIIQDVNEQKWNPLPEPEFDPDSIDKLHEDANLIRGKTGVFDIEELVDLLYQENGLDICVIQIPKELQYSDYMVICTARSPRHLSALATFIKKRFKMKELRKGDLIPIIEGLRENNSNWLALDMGNIILHIFQWKMRETMDLETLWTVGPQYDDLYNLKDSEIVQLLKTTDFSKL